MPLVQWVRHRLAESVFWVRHWRHLSPGFRRAIVRAALVEWTVAFLAGYLVGRL